MAGWFGMGCILARSTCMMLHFRDLEKRRSLRRMQTFHIARAQRLGWLFLLVLLGCAPLRQAPVPTLRAIYGLPPQRSLAAHHTAVILVDFQREFFDGGLRSVAHAPAAVGQAVALRAWARAHGMLVVHVRNVVPRANSPLFAASSSTVQFVSALEPAPDEPVVTKQSAGGFSNTKLHELLTARAIDTLIVAGIMTHLAVDTTARDASVRGYKVVVVADACATRALPSPVDAATIDAREVQRVALASLADRFADVRSLAALRSLPVRSAEPGQAESAPAPLGKSP
jgi:nicotinamidase-related amidase